MSQRHARRNRRPRFQKPDTINIILGSLTIVLLFVWGGLYWKESSQQALIVNADGSAQNEQAELIDLDEPVTEPVITPPAGEVKPADAVKGDKPAEQATEKPAVGGDGAVLPEETTKPSQPDKGSGAVQTTKPAQTEKPNQETAAKPNAGGSTKPATTKPGSTKPVATKPETTKPETTEPETTKPETTKPETPAETKPPVSMSEKYEQEIIQLQAKCTQDMNEVLVGAEASIEQMDQSDPYAFQALNQKWMDSLANVESTCNTNFQTKIDYAEKDNVDPAITEEWQQKFSSLMLQLQGEFEAKMLQLMGG
ncbi:hypothetical protein [Paenibacillus sp. PL91]|uniref:hypothetical protein n=1 Tax=Paenibacillus sp. PL91 TaxID=2729538 RepID=UPI00145C4CF5|nr:hypothetical protein [Paenibacillus sp. PL91]MBC9202226.1 hypothetical protein [Paenibacillus sp. PL91]